MDIPADSMHSTRKERKERNVVSIISKLKPQMSRVVQESKKNKLLKALTLVGCFSTGIIYSSIGTIAILSFLKLKQGGADESSFFVLLNGFTAGRILNWLIILGALCFIIWRFYEAFKDPNHIGKDTKAILLRTGIAFSSAADTFIVLSVLRAIFDQHKAPVTGEPTQQKDMVARLLHFHWGQIAVLIIGAIVLITAVVLVLYGLSKSFTEAINTDDFSERQTRVVHAIAYAGYFSRGVILLITGFFFVKSAVKNNSTYIVNTDKAFDFIGDHIGHPWFILVALGTILYGVYMFILGLHYDITGAKRRK